MRDIKYIVIHCTATPQNTTIDSIRRYWQRIGWRNVGYHLIIKSDGTYERLAEDSQITNGVTGYNRNSIHISYIGGIDASNKPSDNRTREQRETMRTLVRTLKSKYPNAEVLGHRDFPNARKACPSFDVKTWLTEERVINGA